MSSGRKSRDRVGRAIERLSMGDPEALGDVLQVLFDRTDLIIKNLENTSNRLASLEARMDRVEA